MDSLVLQTNVPKMLAVRNETDHKISWAISLAEQKINKQVYNAATFHV